MHLNTQLSKDQSPMSVEQQQRWKQCHTGQWGVWACWQHSTQYPVCGWSTVTVLEKSGAHSPGDSETCMWYLQGTKNWGLTYKGATRGIIGFIGADDTSQEHRQEIPNSAVMIHGGTVSWSSKAVTYHLMNYRGQICCYNTCSQRNHLAPSSHWWDFLSPQMFNYSLFR
jgi:hypothetical protein